MINFVEITSVEIKYKSTEVFDIEVEKEHQYIANNFVVHNCTTSANSSIHYPMVSLLQEIVRNKKYIISCIKHDKEVKIEPPYKSIPKIIADGGFSNFDQIIKALAIGADYVMLGKIFAMSVEACGDILNKHYFPYDVEIQGPFQNWIRKQDMSEIKAWDCY